MASWLQKQRKTELASLAIDSGLSGWEHMLKDELVSKLDEHLKTQEPTLSSHPHFAEYYDRNNGTPVKRSRTVPPADANEAPRSTRPRRRTTRVKEEVESQDETVDLKDKDSSSPLESPSMALATRTPRAVERVATQVPLPPSPAVVTDAIERQTAIVRGKVGEAWEGTGITDYAEYVREVLSSVVGVEAAAILVEAYYLQRQVMPWTYFFDIPAVEALGTNSHPVYLPQLFVLLTSSFWAPSLLWASTSLFVPLLFAYFFNLTLRTKINNGVTTSTTTYRADPLTFNIMKALVTYMVYAQGVRFSGMVGDDTVLKVDGALPGGYQSAMIGAGIGIITSIYEAVLKKQHTTSA
ncbi:uncharacterized protein K452DRAFT_280509 [Aplosporella prunicola CBS 121167]|uniref:Uncharacterized protein n=1 Tax=Aplosporella prunicola CBS 121167 TaxID=1176127 RepID=A0A6A6AY66_9PEZI|nr:uncharacterized protein K452DRAFT_280509 [Aplosporella prunicola CBS 121167]KAF2136113.1 hypothetical protein K452DRAFT_280509 [Aplosporella prunicola CBS 121167]